MVKAFFLTAIQVDPALYSSNAAFADICNSPLRVSRSLLNRLDQCIGSFYGFAVLGWLKILQRQTDLVCHAVHLCAYYVMCS